jgi:hypothetical protein
MLGAPVHPMLDMQRSPDAYNVTAEHTSLSRPKRKDTSAMKTSEVLNAPPADLVAADATEHPATPSPSAVPSAEASSTEVLISEQQVMFSTAAAAAPRRKIRLAAILGRVFVTSTAESSSRRQQSPPRRISYIERARMAREMERL